MSAYVLLILLNELWKRDKMRDLLFIFCLVFASVYMCLVFTFWERAVLLALVCGV